PKLTKRARFHPGDPMRLAVSEDPALILATVWKDGRTNEYIFMPETGWRHVTARVPESFAGIWDSPETAGGAADGGPATFGRAQAACMRWKTAAGPCSCWIGKTRSAEMPSGGLPGWKIRFSGGFRRWTAARC